VTPSILVAVLAFLAIGGAGLAFAGGGQSARAQKRMKAVGAGVQRPDARARVVAEAATAKRRQTTQEALKALGLSEKRARQGRLSIKGQLQQAGLATSMSTFWILSAIAGAALAGGAFLVMKTPIAAAAGAFVGAFGLPRFVVGMLVTARQKKFTNQLADAIDVIVRGVKSGLPLTQCLRIIAQESPEPLRTEFQNLVDAQAMGVPIDQSMQRLYDRMPLPEVNFFAIVLVIQQKTGGNLSESLGNLSNVLRARKLMREKVKALSAEAKASAMIIGALPFVVMAAVYVIRPDYIGVLFTHPTGHLILLGSAIMMGSGILIMRKMINFKF